MRLPIQIVINTIRCNFLQNSVEWVQSHLKFSKIEMALYALQRIFLTLQKVAHYDAYHNSIIKNGGHQARFLVIRALS